MLVTCVLIARVFIRRVLLAYVLLHHQSMRGVGITYVERGLEGWMRAVGEFYDYRDTVGFGRVYQVHRRTIMPAMRMCREWGSLLLDEKTTMACEAQECTDWLGSFPSSMNFWGRAQETVVRAFGLGTGAFAIWMDTIKIRHYDARMVIPLTWDYEDTRECAFVTRAFSKGGVWTSCRCMSSAMTGLIR